MLGIVAKHLLGLMGLPLHHRDPFDRLLIAQAVTEDVTLISRDCIIDRYSVR